MAAGIPRVRKRGSADHGRQTGQVHLRAEGGRREGGADVLRRKPKGRPKGSKAEPRRHAHEQELKEHYRRLEAEVPYLNNCAL